jgi:hypothetical protein
MLIFYRPESNDTEKPPAPHDPTWNLGDDDGWKRENAYPVYAIPGPAGTKLMQQLALYSENFTEPQPLSEPPGSFLSLGCARLYALLDLGKPHRSMYGYSPC